MSRLIDADALRESIITRQTEMSYEDAWALTCVDNAPTIQPQKWVPCSERLPEEGTEVLGTDRNGCIRHVYKDKTRLYEFATVEEGMHIGIVAWMPLPDPYKEDKT